MAGHLEAWAEWSQLLPNFTEEVRAAEQGINLLRSTGKNGQKRNLSDPFGSCLLLGLPNSFRELAKR